QCLELYLKRYPNDADPLNNLAATLLTARRPREALAPLQRAMRVKPGHVLAHVNAGFAYADLREHPEALSMFRQATALKYDTPAPPSHAHGPGRRVPTTSSCCLFSSSADAVGRAGCRSPGAIRSSKPSRRWPWSWRTSPSVRRPSSSSPACCSPRSWQSPRSTC